MEKDICKNLSKDDVADAFQALGNKTRLKIILYLSENAATTVNNTINASDLCQYLGIAHNKLNFHMTHLEKVNLIEKTKQGREQLYQINLPLINELLEFMMRECFGAIDIRYRISRRAISRSGLGTLLKE